MRVASGPTANLSYLFVAGYALSGRAQALQALALSWFFSMLSTAVAPQASVASVGRYGVLIAAAISVVAHKPNSSRFRHNKPLVQATFLLGFFFIVHSLLFSKMVDVSVLKSISWTLAMTTLIAGWSGVSDDLRELITNQLFVGLVAITVFSLPLLVMPAGYLVNGTGFQGVFGHPEAFGVTMALLGAWCAVRMVASPNPSWLLVLLATVCLGLVVRSEARTAGLALVLGVAVAITVAPALSGRPALRLLPGLRSPRVHITIGILLVGLMVAWPLVADRAETFIAKRGGTTDLKDAYDASRGGLIELMWANIEENPWQGIGFGIGSQPELMVVQRDPILGLPISAVVEKGVMPFAVFEEIGLPGLVFVATWLWVMLRRSVRTGPEPLAVILVILLINLGEYSFFSFGGMGLIEMILLAWGATGEPVGIRRR